jgi:hypothetical protein
MCAQKTEDIARSAHAGSWSSPMPPVSMKDYKVHHALLRLLSIPSDPVHRTLRRGIIR